jgi:hypothetical protein
MRSKSRAKRSNTELNPLIGDFINTIGQTRSWGHIGSMSGFPENGHGWAIYEYTPFCNGPVMSSLPE